MLYKFLSFWLIILSFINTTSGGKIDEIAGDFEPVNITFNTFNALLPYPQFFDAPLVNTSVSISLKSIPKLTSGFIVLQAHALNPILLSYNATLTSGFYDNGTNLGLVYTFPTSDIIAYLINPFKQNVLLFAGIYNEDFPIPGGCNLEMPIKIAPYLKMMIDRDAIVVDTQPASLQSGTQKSCDSVTLGALEYNAYHFFLPRGFSWDDYSKYLKALREPKYIAEVGANVLGWFQGSQLRRVFNRYYGQAELFMTTASVGNSVSAYVPVVTFACDWDFELKQCTDSFMAPFYKGCLLFFGLVIIGFSMCSKKPDGDVSFEMGAIVGYCVAFIRITLPGDNDYDVFLPYLCGLVAGLFFKIVMKAVEEHSRLVVTTLMAGAFLTSLLVYNTYADVLGSGLEYWLWFTCLTLLFATIILTRAQPVYVSCTIIGAYLLVLSLDLLWGSSLKYVVINQYRRVMNGLQGKYSQIIFDPPPFGYSEIILLLVGLVIPFMNPRAPDPDYAPLLDPVSHDYYSGPSRVRTHSSSTSSPLDAYEEYDESGRLLYIYYY